LMRQSANLVGSAIGFKQPAGDVTCNERLSAQGV
jgi:hypothetical protein